MKQLSQKVPLSPGSITACSDPSFPIQHESFIKQINTVAINFEYTRLRFAQDAGQAGLRGHLIPTEAADGNLHFSV
jgi:hypothetical protein